MGMFGDAYKNEAPVAPTPPGIEAAIVETLRNVPAIRLVKFDHRGDVMGIEVETWRPCFDWAEMGAVERAAHRALSELTRFGPVAYSLTIGPESCPIQPRPPARAKMPDIEVVGYSKRPPADAPPPDLAPLRALADAVRAPAIILAAQQALEAERVPGATLSWDPLPRGGLAVRVRLPGGGEMRDRFHADEDLGAVVFFVQRSVAFLRSAPRRDQVGRVERRARIRALEALVYRNPDRPLDMPPPPRGWRP